MTLTTPGGKPDLVHDLGELEDGERILRRRLHHDGAADGERRCDLAGHVDEREVVRRDARDHADRLAVDDGADQAAGGEGSGARSVTARAAMLRSFVAPRAYRSKRSIATGTCIREPTIAVAPVSLMMSGTRSAVALAELVGDGVEQPGPLGRRRAPPRRGTRPARGPCRGERLVDRRLGRVADDLLGRGVDDVVRAAGAIDPLAADEQPILLRHVACTLSGQPS